MLNSNFPRILTLLRKERGLSQKKAAADLGISQALLSHYEKGIRECGLEFLVRAAEYYDVSCDFLLGRTPHRRGEVISPGSLPSEGAATLSRGGNSATEYQRRVLTNSLHIVFGILKKINSPGLSRHVENYLACAVYQMFRLLYSARKKNPQEAFSLDRRLYRAQSAAHMTMEKARAGFLLEGGGLENAPGIQEDALPPLSPAKLSSDYPLYAPSLMELVRNTEEAISQEKP